jgi:hypothetical protein
MDLLSPIIGETAARIVILVGVLLLLAALTMLLVGVAFRVFRGRGFGFRGSRNRAPRLSVPDIMPIDSKRKLVLVRRDTVEHLLLIGGATDLVIEQSIQRPVQAVARGRMAASALQPTQPIVAQSEIPAAPPSTPQAPGTGRLGIPMPPPRTARPTAAATLPPDAESVPPVDLAPIVPPARQVGIAMPPRPMPLPEGGAAEAVRSNGWSNGHYGGVHLNGETATEETFTAGAIPEASSSAAPDGKDDQLERDFAAVVPDVVEASMASRPADQPEAEAGTDEDSERERAQRLTSRETEMAQLLNEIFGKR